MPNWITRPLHTETDGYVLCFERILHPGTGFQFECSATGEVDSSKLTMASRMNLAMCRTSRVGEFRTPYVVATKVKTQVAGVIACTCGRHLSLDKRGVNHCGCGLSYWENGEEVSEEAHGY